MFSVCRLPSQLLGKRHHHRARRVPIEFIAGFPGMVQPFNTPPILQLEPDHWLVTLARLITHDLRPRHKVHNLGVVEAVQTSKRDGAVQPCERGAERDAEKCLRIRAEWTFVSKPQVLRFERMQMDVSRFERIPRQALAQLREPAYNSAVKLSAGVRLVRYGLDLVLRTELLDD